MNFEIGKVRTPLWLILTIAISAATAGVGYWYYKVNTASIKELGLAGGILTGLLVYLATFLTLLRPIIELDRFHRMGIKALLANRHDKDYYRKLVKNSKFKVDVLGASCSRFVRDFLDPDDDDAVLIDALNKNRSLRVRLLIPTDRHMGDEARSATAATLKRMAVLQQRFSGRVELRRFDDVARHSFVVADDDLVAGPVFDDDKSRHAPAVHVVTGTMFGQKYSAYFESIWEHAEIA
jgi:hypothetical protein